MVRVGLYSVVGTFSLATMVGVLMSVPWEATGALFVLAAAIWCSTRKIQLVMLLCVTALALLRVAVIPANMPDAFESLIGTDVSLEGVVVRLPDVRETSTRATVRVEYRGERTLMLVVAPLFPLIHVGDVVTIEGAPEEPEPFDTDGGRRFRYDEFLRKDGVHSVMQPASVVVHGTSSSLQLQFLRLLERTKSGFMTLLARALPEPESALAAGLIVGGKQGLGTRLLEAFTVSGMLQIVVLSGYNVMIIANGIMRAFSFLSRRTAAIMAGISIICFVFAAGAGASAMRAGIMAVLAIVARASRKSYDVLRMLALTLFGLTLVNPLMLVYDPGFQFSFLATVGLVIGSPILVARLSFVRNGFVREMLATTLAAQAGVLPLLLWQTGNLSLVSVFANVLVTPVIPFAMASSALAALLAFPLGWIGSVVPFVAGVPAFFSLAYVIRVATVSASLPLASVIIPTFPFWIVILSYGSLIAFVRREHMKMPVSQEAGIRAHV